MNKFNECKKAYNSIPSQDNEGYTPELGSFKTGFFAAWDLLEQENNDLKMELKEERNTIDDLRVENAKLQETLKLIAMPRRSDGTYNLNREACEKLASALLTGRGE
jgi:hypothetical protein